MGLFSAIAGPLVGSAVSGLFSSKGNKKANSQFQPGFSRSEPVIGRASPFNINTIFGNSSGGQFTSSNDFQRGQSYAAQLVSQTGNAAQQADPNAFATRFLESMNRVNDKREAQGFASLESKLFNRSGASTGTQRQIADFRNDIEDRRFGRGIQAQQLGMQNQTSAINAFLAAMGGQQSLQGAQLDQIGAGLQGSRTMAPFSLGQRTEQRGQNSFAAQTTKDFWDGLGGTIGSGIETGIDYFNNPFTGGGGGDPFNGSGPQLSFQNAQAPRFNARGPFF